MPTPNPAETQEEFLARCMGDKEQSMFDPKCAAMHLGLWAIEPQWLSAALAVVRSGDINRASAEDNKVVSVHVGGLAVIEITGQMQKGQSKFGGTSTVAVRQTLRAAVRDEEVRGVMLHIDSPGGTVSGTAELAADVAAASAEKPVYAHVDDLGASAAYWVASQAGRLSANAIGEIGSVGTFAVVQDTSKAAEMAGVEVHVVSTGGHKGAFSDGAPITPDQLEDLQARVEAANEFFLAAIAAGRAMPPADVREIANGRIYIAAEAKKLGLIDRVESYEEALEALAKQAAKSRTPRRDRAARKARAADI